MRFLFPHRRYRKAYRPGINLGADLYPGCCSPHVIHEQCVSSSTLNLRRRGGLPWKITVLRQLEGRMYPQMFTQRLGMVS
jgi:hypothetical protein